MITRLVLLLSVTLFVQYGHGQDSISKSNLLHHFPQNTRLQIAGKIDSLSGLPGLAIEKLNPRVFKSNDTLWIYSGICKPLKTSMHIIASGKALNSKIQNRVNPFMKIRGNVQYDFLYRSFIDTPFSQHDFQQHTIHTALSIVVKDRYPVKLNLSTRVSNSPFFRNFTDVNMQFDRHAYLRGKKQQLLDKIAVDNFQRPDLKRAEAALHEQVDKYNSLNVLILRSFNDDLVVLLK